MDKLHLILFSVIGLFFVGIITAEQNSYRAAVLEYPPLKDRTTALENWQDNVKEILHFIRDASNQKAQIIVLPEDALSGWEIAYKDLEALSTLVPDPRQHIAPCTLYHANNFSTTLREFSCAAQTYRIYIVVNLIEKVVAAENSKPIYHNTNVVFNRKGEIIVRYRKINLYDEPNYVPGNEIVTFTTDFGVTFGMFICFDLLFKIPSSEILSNLNVTDIVYSAAWFSHLPFYHSLSVQHGYAKAYGVNLLAAGMNEPSQSMGGSGIYLADGRISETFVSGTPLSKLLIQDVPKISSRIPNSSCKFQKSSGSYEWGVDSMTGNISGFHAIKDDMKDYTFKSLNLLQQSDIVETICSSSSTFCCTFNISTSKTHNVQPNYIYKLAAFQGTRKTKGVQTVGIRNCAIVACLNDNTDTCGARKLVPPKGIMFEKISIKATVDNKNVRYQPVTLTFDLKPITDYTFCILENGKDKVDISMETTESHDSLLTFGLISRVFGYDNLPLGPINNAAANKLNIIFVLFVAIVSVSTFQFKCI